MKRISKLLALFLALIMLVTISTACKKPQEDMELGLGDEEIIDDPDNESEGEEDEDDKEVNSGDKDEDDEKENNSDKDDEKENDDNKDNNKDNNKTEDDKDEDKPAADVEDLKDNFDETKKYDADSNPLVAEKKPLNTGVEPGFDLDTTGFVKNGIKLKDLKGKSLTLITAIMYDTFQYKDDKGKQVGEWEWWDALKSKYGLQIKYIKSRFDKSPQQILTYMNAGKALDVIPTHVGGFPRMLNLSQPLDPYVNMQNLGNSPGVDIQCLEDTKWGGTYRCISPIGAVNVLWYNQSLVEEFNLQDPHTLYQQDKWNWDTFASFLRSVPKTTSAGKKLYAYFICSGDSYYAYALTNGTQPIEIDTKSSTPNLINNWTDDRVLASYTMFESVLESIQHGGSWSSMFTNGDVMMGDTLNLMNDYDNSEEELYCHTHKYNWVPYPKATTSNGRYACFNYGYTMMLPRKMKNQSNAPYAVKFMELWATRFTEAIFDYQASTSYLNFDYAARKEYFEFVTQHTYFGVQQGYWDIVSEDARKAQSSFFSAVYDPSKSQVTEATKIANYAQQVVEALLKYGN